MAIVSCGIRMPDVFGKLLMSTQAHLGSIHSTDKMGKYIYARREDKLNVFDIKILWEKFVLAARACAGLPDTNNIIAISNKTFGPKPILRFAESVQCRPYTGRFIPGSFTNKNIRNSSEPSLIIVSDPIFDNQAIKEAASVRCPAIAFCNADADLKYVDIAIPVNNRSPRAIGACFFILSRLINYIKKGADMTANVKDVELFFYRDAKELERLCEEQNAENKLNIAEAPEQRDETDFGRVEEETADNVWDN